VRVLGRAPGQIWLRPRQASAQAVGPDLLYRSGQGLGRKSGQVPGSGGLTSHSSRRRFAARLNSGVMPQLATWFRVVAPRPATPRGSKCLSASSRFSHTRRASLSGLASDTDGSLVANGQPPPGVGCRRFGRSGAGSWPARPSGAASVAARSKACRAPISIVA